MNRFYGLSTPLRFLAYAILAGMIALAAYALLSRQPPQPILTTAQVEETAAAAVFATLQAVYAEQTAAAPTANIAATVDARLTQVAQGTPLPTATPAPSATPSPTATPEPSTVDQVVGVAGQAVNFIGGLIVGLWNFLVSVWNFLSFGGWLLQVCCCIGLPALIIIGALAER